MSNSNGFFFKPPKFVYPTSSIFQICNPSVYSIWSTLSTPRDLYFSVLVQTDSSLAMLVGCHTKPPCTDLLGYVHSFQVSKSWEGCKHLDAIIFYENQKEAAGGRNIVSNWSIRTSCNCDDSMQSQLKTQNDRHKKIFSNNHEHKLKANILTLAALIHWEWTELLLCAWHCARNWEHKWYSSILSLRGASSPKGERETHSTNQNSRFHLFWEKHKHWRGSQWYLYFWHSCKVKNTFWNGT